MTSVCVRSACWRCPAAPFNCRWAVCLARQCQPFNRRHQLVDASSGVLLAESAPIARHADATASLAVDPRNRLVAVVSSTLTTIFALALDAPSVTAGLTVVGEAPIGCATDVVGRTSSAHSVAFVGFDGQLLVVREPEDGPRELCVVPHSAPHGSAASVGGTNDLFVVATDDGVTVCQCVGDTIVQQQRAFSLDRPATRASVFVEQLPNDDALHLSMAMVVNDNGASRLLLGKAAASSGDATIALTTLPVPGGPPPFVLARDNAVCLAQLDHSPMLALVSFATSDVLVTAPTCVHERVTSGRRSEHLATLRSNGTAYLVHLEQNRHVVPLATVK